MKKIILLLLALVFALSVISLNACKPATPVETAAETETTAATETAAETAAETEAALDFSGVELNVLMMAHPPALEAAKMGAAEFETMTGAKVNIVEAPYATLKDLALTAFVGKTGAYDVISVPYQWTGTFADPGFIIPLTDFIAADDPDLADYIPKAVALYGSWKEQVVELPWNGEAMLLFYRTDLLEAEGLQPPATWDDFNNICKVFTGNAKYPDTYGTAIMALKEQDMTMLTNRYWGLGGELLDANGNPTFDNQTMITALNMLMMHTVDYSPPGALGFGLPEAVAPFMEGKVVMEEQWPLVIGMASEDPAQSTVVGKVGAAQVPGSKPHSGGWGLAIAADSKNPDAAYQLIKYLTNKENDKRFFIETGKAPTRTSTYADPELASKYYFFTELAKAIDNANPRFRDPKGEELNAMMDEKISQFLAGELTAEECATAMNDEAKTILGK